METDHRSQHYPFKSFENLDPLEIGHTYMLVAGKKKVPVSHECKVVAAKVEESVVEIVLERDYELTCGLDDLPLVPMGKKFTLRFDSKIPRMIPRTIPGKA